jgi:hypothetical protein
VGEAPAPQLTDRPRPPPQRGNGRERLTPAGRTQAHATVTRAGARQAGRGRRARSGVHRGVRADLLDVLRRPLVDDLLPEVGREAFGLNCGSSKGQRSREVASPTQARCKVEAASREHCACRCGQVRLHISHPWHGSEGGLHSKELGGAPVREVEMEPSGAAQPHLEAAGIADAPRLGHGADPQPRRGRTAEVNGRRRQCMGASPRSFSRVTEFWPSRGGLRGARERAL